MSPTAGERHVALAATGLQEISQEFVDEVGRKPSSRQLFEVLTWAMRSCPEDTFRDVHPANVTALKPKRGRGAKRAGSRSSPEEEESAVGDLNDDVFVIASDFLSALAKAIKADTGHAPTLDELCRVLVEGLHQNGERVVDTSPRDIVGIRAEISTRTKVVSKVGDVIAIPAKNAGYFFAVVLAKNAFGTAYGFFEDPSALRPISIASHPRPKAHPIYSGDRFVANGRWKIIGHDHKLLSLFPAKPEIYHREQITSEGPEIGPYGSGETASGRLRHLTKEEAEAIGLLSGDYRQGYLEEDLEAYLNRKPIV